MITTLAFFETETISSTGVMRSIVAFVPLVAFMLLFYYIILPMGVPALKKAGKKIIVYVFLMALVYASVYGIQDPRTLEEGMLYAFLSTTVINIAMMMGLYLFAKVSFKWVMSTVIFMGALSVGVAYLMWEYAPQFDLGEFYL